MKVLAIIPARGGSKGIPGKNIYPILGKPLILYTVETALESTVLQDVYVSSDSEEILNVVKDTGVKISLRPSDLAIDTAPIIPTIEYTLRLAEKENKLTYDAIMLLQPTSPIRQKSDIERAIALLVQYPEANSVISVCQMTDMHPARMYFWDEKSMQSCMPEFEQVRRQDIPPVYYRNGSIYLVRRNAFLTGQSVMLKPSVPCVMKEEYLLNIDSPKDILVSEVLINAWKKGVL